MSTRRYDMKLRILAAVLFFLTVLAASSGLEAQEIEASQSGARVTWLVEPSLPYDDIYYCQYCNLLRSQQYVGNIRIRLKELLSEYSRDNNTLWICRENCAVRESYMFDEKRGLYGYYYDSEGVEIFIIQQRSAFFEQNTDMANRPLAFKKIDSDKVKTVEQDWGTSYDFSDAIVSSKYAIAFNGTFVTGFIYDAYCYYLKGVPHGIIAVKLNNKWGILDKNGYILIPFDFDDITLIDENSAFAEYNGRYGILDLRNSSTEN